MALGTHLGAGTPIRLGGLPLPGLRGNRPEGGKSPEGADAAERTVLNDAIAALRSLTQLCGRNVEWAIEALRDSPH